MPQNVTDADLWTATVQTAIDGDHVEGASRLLEAQDLADRSRYLYNRLQLVTAIQAVTHHAAAGPYATIETVAAGALTTAASFYVTVNNIVANDIIHVCGSCFITAAAVGGGTFPQISMESPDTSQWPGTGLAFPGGAAVAGSITWNTHN
jgi:hypothetical protein